MFNCKSVGITRMLQLIGYGRKLLSKSNYIWYIKLKRYFSEHKDLSNKQSEVLDSIYSSIHGRIKYISDKIKRMSDWY